MKSTNKTKEQLLKEVELLKAKIFKLEKPETERKRAEEALKKSEERLTLAVEGAGLGLWDQDFSSGKIIRNERWAEMLGYKLEEIEGSVSSWKKLIHPDDLPSIEKNIQDHEQGRSSLYSVEHRMLAKDGEWKWINNWGRVVERDKDGRPLRALGVHLDITERKQTEKSLKEKQQLNKLLLNSLPHPAMLINTKRIVQAANKVAADLGVKLGDYCWKGFGKCECLSDENKKLAEENPDDERIKCTFCLADQAMKDPKLKGMNNPGVHAFGKIWDTYWDLIDKNTFLHYAIDISERKKLENSIEFERDKLNFILQELPIGVSVLDADHKFTYINPISLQLDGYPEDPQSILGKHVNKVHPQKNQPKVEQLFQDFASGKKSIVTREAKRGKRTIEISYHALRDSQEKYMGLVRLVSNITERKKAEKEIERLSRFPDESPDPVLRVNIEGIVYYANIASEELLKKWKTSVGDKLPVSLMQSMINIVAETGNYNFEQTCDEKVFEIRCVPIENYGYINLYGRDITERLSAEQAGKRAGEKIKEKSIQLEKQVEKSEQQRIATLSVLSDLKETTEDLHYEINVRKQTEETLLKNEFFLNQAQRIANLGSYELDIPSGTWTSSVELNNVFGIDDNYDKSVEGWGNIVHPDDREDMLSYFANKILKEGKKFDREYRIIRVSDNEERWVHGIGELDFDDEGKPVKMIGTIQDITERKRVENALAMQRQRLADILEGTNAGTWDWNVQTGEVTFNERWAEIIGYTLDELAPIDINTWINNVHPDDLPIANALLDKHFNREADYYDVEFRQPHKDGRWVWVNARGKVIEWTEEGKPLRMSGTHLDITKRKLAEEEIRKLSYSVEQSPAIVIITDTNGNIEYVNPKFEEVTGYTAEEVIGKNPNILKGDDTTPEEYEILWKTIKAGGTWHGEFHNRKKNGELYWESASISGIKDRNEQTTHFIAVKEDITERKAMEQRIRKSRNQLRSLAERLQMIREEERASIAREIHDDLGQTLTALKMDISRMKKNVGMSEEMRAEKINAMLGLTDSTIQTVKRIATELRPGILDDLGLIPAIEWEAEEFRKRSDIKCNLQITAEDVSIEDTISIAVFRIFQESLTNIARHSGATRVDVSIEEEGDLLKMGITDNGVGISEEQINSSKSLGLMGMNERVSFFGGRIVISSPAEGGTTVKVYIPVIKAK